MQNKFIKQDTPLLSLTKEAIKVEIKRGNERFNHEVYNTRHLTECPRRLTYRVRNYDRDFSYNFLIDNDLESTKKKWVDFFSQCKKVDVLDKNVQAADCNYNLAGRADAVIRVGEFVSILRVDVLNPTEYEKAKSTGGLRRQIVDTMLMVWLTETENGILLCENRATKEYFLSHIIPYKPIIERVTEKCKDLIQNRMLHTLPDRVYDDGKSPECKTCEYRETCWNKKERIHGTNETDRES